MEVNLESQNNHPITNFGGNLRFTPQYFYQPENEGEVLEILNQHRNSKIRAIASLHSWSEVMVSEDVIVDLSHLDTVEISPLEDGGVEVTVGAGCKLQKLLDTIHGQTDYTLPTLGAIKEQTVAGAISTGTHGSGRPSLSHYARKLYLAAYDESTGKAKIYHLDGGIELQAVRCALGCMGIILSVTFPCIPKYYVAETVCPYPTLEQVLAQEQKFPLQEFIFTPYLEKFYGYQRRESDRPAQTLAEKFTTQFYRLYNLIGIDIFFHLIVKFLASGLANPSIIKGFYRYIAPIIVFPAQNIIDDSDISLTRKHHLFKHLEMEVFISQSNILPAMNFIREVINWFAGERETFSDNFASQLKGIGMLQRLKEKRGVYTHHYPLYCRRVLPDDTLISMASSAHEPYYTISFFTYQKDKTSFYQLANFLASSLSKLYNARLHWGKYFPLTNTEIEHLYSHLETFRNLCLKVDPQGVFRSSHINEVLGFK